MQTLAANGYNAGNLIPFPRAASPRQLHTSAAGQLLFLHGAQAGLYPRSWLSPLRLTKSLASPSRMQPNPRRKLYLLASICVNVGVLGLFKCYDFVYRRFRASFTAPGCRIPAHFSGCFLLSAFRSTWADGSALESACLFRLIARWTILAIDPRIESVGHCLPEEVGAFGFHRALFSHQSRRRKRNNRSDLRICCYCNRGRRCITKATEMSTKFFGEVSPPVDSDWVSRDLIGKSTQPAALPECRHSNQSKPKPARCQVLNHWPKYLISELRYLGGGRC